MLRKKSNYDSLQMSSNDSLKKGVIIRHSTISTWAQNDDVMIHVLHY